MFSRPVVFTAVVALATLLWFLLAENISNLNLFENSDTVPEVKSTGSLDCKGAFANSALCLERNSALKALNELTKKLSTAETKYPRNRLSQVSSKKRAGDKFYFEEFFFKAEKSYAEALNLLSQVENEIFKEISVLKEEGVDLFNKQELGKALNNFEKIIQIDSSDNFAKKYIYRIEVFPQVTEKIILAKEQRDNGLLEKSLKTFETSFALDPEREGLLNEIALTEKYILDFNFENAIKEGYAFLFSNSFEKAEKKLKLAKSLKPNDKSVALFAANFKEKKSAKDLSESIAKGKESYFNEEWQKAISDFEKALSINGNLEEITDLYNKSLENKELNKELDFIISNQTRLASDNIFNEATKLLKNSKRLDFSNFPIMDKKIKEVDEILTRYSIKTLVNIYSDKNTFLEIENAKKFEPFEEMKIKLRPGNYIFIAKARGKVSVRKKIIIDFSNSELNINVDCSNDCKIIRL